MHKTLIWSNPSQQRSLVQPIVAKSEIKEYLNLSLQGTNTKEIMIFPGMEYQISFYDAKYGVRKILTGLVMNVYEDQIKLKVVEQKTVVNCDSCDKKDSCNKQKQNSAPMPTCNCILNPPDTSKYNDPEIYFIPIANIMDVLYIQGNNPDKKPEEKRKGGTKVMILGISATIVRAIIIRLEIFDDNFDEAVKYVDLEVGGIYDLAYEAHKTIYESRVRVVGIRELEDHPVPHHDRNPHIVRENVGMNNEVYYDDYNKHDKTDFMKEPPVRKVEITVDTSETFDGNLEIIMLDQIRDCTLIQAPLPDDVIYQDPSFTHEPDCNCGCNHNEF